MKAPPAGLRAVLFDWDGTLVDSAEASYRCYERLFGEYGITFDRGRFQRTYSPNWHRTYEALGLPRESWAAADARWLCHYGEEETRLLPGARTCLERLRGAGLALGIVTSGDRPRVTAEIERLGLSALFGSVTGAEDTERRKPHPEPLWLGLARAGVTPSEAAYVGDSPEDVEMARAAGVWVLGVPGGFPNREALAASGPDGLVGDLAAAADALLGVLEREASGVVEDVDVPMVDLVAQHARVEDEVAAAFARVVGSARFIGGEECEALEAEFASYCGAAYACGVANGTDALTLALRAYGVGPGDEVVTVANTFIATGEAILLCGARPVFVDVEPETCNLDPDRLQRALTARTKVILPVHVYGHPADMDPILAIAARHGVPVLEDAAQAHGATLGGRRAGGLGHAACFSFYPAKNMGAYGDAGMVTSSDAAFIDRVRRLGNHGAGTHRYDNVVAGTNSRLDALQAAVLRVKLRHLEEWNAERRLRVEAYTRALAGTPGLGLPTERAGARSAWHLYTVRSRDRDGLRARLARARIATAVHYPRPIHLQPAMAAAGGRPGDLPVSERLCAEVLSLPLYPELGLETVERVAAEVRRA